MPNNIAPNTMRKLFVITATSLLLFSCGGNKTTKNIEKAFKQYVALNFDDPKSVIEIVEISLKDTISVKKFYDGKHALDSLLETVISWSKTHSEFQSEVFGRINKIPAWRYSERDAQKISQNAGKFLMNFTTKNMLFDRLRPLGEELVKKAEKVGDEPPIYIYEIKFRQSMGSGIKLRTYYASYTKESGMITIFEDRFTADGNDNIKKYNGSIAYRELADAYYELFQNMFRFTEILTAENGMFIELNGIVAKYR